MSQSPSPLHHASRRPNSPDLLQARKLAVELLDAIKEIKTAGELGGLAHWYCGGQPDMPFEPVPNRLPSLIRAFDAVLKPLLHELWQAFSGTVRVGNVSAKTHFEAVLKLADDVCGVLLLAIRARQPLDEQTVANLKKLHAARELPDFDFSLSQVDCEIVPKYVRRMVRVSYADIEFLKEAVTSEAIDLQKQRAAPKQSSPTTPRRTKRRRRRTDTAPPPLTAKQAEAVQIVGECKGNFTEAARRLGLKSAKTVRQSYLAGLQKLGRKAVKHATQRLPSDRRGQDAVTSDDDRRRA